jgi:hypothetical protein
MLLTIPSTPEKGEFQTYTLDVSDLIDLVTQEYYQNQDNWRRVIVAYKSLTGNQLNLLSFTPDGGDTLTKQGFFAPESFSFFIIQSITIVDKQNGTYILTNNEIPDVANYNLVFVSGGASFYDIISTYGTWMDSSDDNSLLALQVAYESYYGAQFFYSMVVNNTSGERNDDLTAFVNNYKVYSYYFNADESKVYIVGKLGLSYLGETLPAIPVGSTYTANPPRIVSVDTITNEVVYIATLEDAGAFSGFLPLYGNITITVDEVNNVAVIVGNSYVVGYNIVTGSKLWAKFVTFTSEIVQYKKVELYSTDSFIIGSLTSYDGGVLTSYSPIKVNIVTGNRDVTFPVAQNDGAGNGYQWSMTPDKSKIIQMGSSGQSRFYVFSGVSWSPIVITSPVVSYNSMTTDNSSIYFVLNSGVKFDFSGVIDPLFNLSVPFFYSFNNIIYAGANLYADGGKFNSTTGAYNATYGISGSYSYAQRAIGNSVYYMPSILAFYVTNPSFFNLNLDSSYGSVAIIDTITREKLIDFSVPFVNPTVGYGPIFGPTGSNVVFAGTSDASQFKAYNYNTGVVDSSYPAINSSTQSVGGYGRDGDYIYISSLNDGANTFNVTDTSGTYNLATKVMRFNMVTKLVDQTFLPVVPSPFGGQSQSYSFTDNYIFICSAWSDSQQGTSGAYLHRINRTTLLVEEIFPTTFGVSTPATFNSFTRARVQQIATNKIVIYVDSGNLKLDNKAYVVCTEDSLTQTGLQPDTIAQFPRYLAFNVTNNELGGIYFGSDGTWHFISYSMVDNSKSTNLIAATDGNTALQFSSGSMLIPSNLVIMPFEESYMIFFNGFFTTAFSPVGGVIKMNPIGIINND